MQMGKKCKILLYYKLCFINVTIVILIIFSLQLLSYPNQALTFRSNINCSHPLEQLLLSQFTYLVTKIHHTQFGGFQEQFGCQHNRRFHLAWLDSFKNQNDYGTEMNYLEGLIYSGK